jgi:two-component sensor histidine kinase
MNIASHDVIVEGLKNRTVLDVLLIEDDEEYVHLIQEHLARENSPELRLVVRKNLQDGIEFVQKNHVDAVLLDLFLPDSRGLESVSRFCSGAPPLPVIVQTSLDDEATALQAVQHGAEDYLVKDQINSALLTRTIRYAIERNQIRKDLEAANIKLGKFNEELEIQVRQRTTELQTSLQEKEVLLKEIHHRVKNNLQVISSLLRLQSETVRDKAIAALFLDSQERVRAMAMVHEFLYKSADLTRINFPAYVDSLVQNLYRTFGLTSSESLPTVEVDDVRLSLDVAVPCGLLLTELISNAVKYAYPDRKWGPVEVRFRDLSKGLFELSVSDHGSGFPKDFDWKKSDSLGLRLVRLLTEQLQGEIRVENHHGMKFVVTFKDREMHEKKKKS